eukprot:scaffold2310_cov105-Isochrysis_galbana.AAC.5
MGGSPCRTPAVILKILALRVVTASGHQARRPERIQPAAARSSQRQSLVRRFAPRPAPWPSPWPATLPVDRGGFERWTQTQATGGAACCAQPDWRRVGLNCPPPGGLTALPTLQCSSMGLSFAASLARALQPSGDAPHPRKNHVPPRLRPMHIHHASEPTHRSIPRALRRPAPIHSAPPLHPELHCPRRRPVLFWVLLLAGHPPRRSGRADPAADQASGGALPGHVVEAWLPQCRNPPRMLRAAVCVRLVQHQVPDSVEGIELELLVVVAGGVGVEEYLRGVGGQSGGERIPVGELVIAARRVLVGAYLRRGTVVQEYRASSGRLRDANGAGRGVPSLTSKSLSSWKMGELRCVNVAMTGMSASYSSSAATRAPAALRRARRPPRGCRQTVQTIGRRATRACPGRRRSSAALPPGAVPRTPGERAASGSPRPCTWRRRAAAGALHGTAAAAGAGSGPPPRPPGRRAL